MRPHLLRLSAFGPFAGEVTVDFDALADGGLFLLHGDTGSGKTSILDGVAFALYGRVPGQRSQAGRLRSDHADPSLRTSVELEVSIGSRRFRITRLPEQARPKLRGAGTTKEPARVLLQEALDGGWVTLSTRVGEADEELSRLLGMSAEQFHQVVLLPQGEFARFLRSGANERAQLLQRLFSTDRFRRAEDWLAERRRQTAAELDAARVTVLRSAARVAQVAGVEEPTDGEGGLPPLGWATELEQSAAANATAAERTAEAARCRQGEVELRLAAVRDVRRRQLRRQDLQRQQGELDAAAPALADAAQRMEAARRAAVVRPVLDQLSRRRDRSATAVQEATGARSDLSPLGLESLATAALRAEGDRRRQALGRLDAAQRLEDEQREQAARQRTAGQTEAALREERDRLRARAELLPEQRSRLREEVEEVAAARARMPELAGEVDRLTRAAEAAARRDDAERSRSARAAELLAARERAVELREEAARLRVERVDSMIAELAAALVESDPCPVCGATEHPDPSEVLGSRVTREQEDAARVASEQAQQVVADLASSVARLDAEIEGWVARLADASEQEAQVDRLRSEAARVSRELTDLREKVGRGDEVATRLAALDEVERSLQQQLGSVDQKIALEAERGQQSAERVRDLLDQLDGLLDGAADVATARRREEAVLRLLDAAVSAEQQVGVADQELAAAEAEAADAATAAGFATVEAAAEALLPGEQLAALEAQIEEFRAAVAAVGAALAEPEMVVDLTVTAPVEDVEQEYRQAEEAARETAAIATRTRSKASDLADLAPSFESALTALQPLHERAASVRALADLVAGQGSNRLRMTLSAYVLAARLEEVAAVASERLRRMTQGRYTLVHTDAGRGGGRSGLGLLARDTWTGQDRDTATLSGGETFLASLALALALGDVVTAEAGGAAIEALFVDEGFGSLDEETLEEVMDTLDGLREGGRMVGLVSHVTELRSRIPAQLQVRKGRNGSTVSLQIG